LENEILSQVSEVTEKYDESAIQVLEGLEAVRKRPGMYIGTTGVKGLHHLVYEIVDNSIDEALAGFCSHIKVDILNEDIICVEDDGRGIPVGIQEQTGESAVTVVFTKLHAGGKFGGSGYKVSGGLHGVGASVVNALSSWLEVTVSNGEYEYTQRFEKGDAVTDLIKGNPTTKTGTKITFKPDPTIFTETTEFDFDILLTRLREQAFLNAGINVTLTDMRDNKLLEDGSRRTENICYEGGIKSFVEYLLKRRGHTALHDEVIYLSWTDGETSAEIALQYNDSYNNNIISFANNIHTIDGGTHESNFKTSITRVFNSYARKYGFLKDTDNNLKGDDAQEGLIAVISVKLKDAQFESQTKSKLGNTFIGTIVAKLVGDKLMEYFEENPQTAKAIIEKAVSAATARTAAQKARELARRKTGLSNVRMPDKLADCISTDIEKTEIYIVEGDSAGGSAIQGRDRNYQAILSLWGKMLNVEKARVDKVYGNDKLTPIVIALGTGIGDEFDISKLRYGKIIIMADADVDGAHIRTLLLTFFFRYMRPLIEEGHVYIAQPPLFEVKKGKTAKYAFSEAERDQYIEELGGSGNVKVQRYKGLGEMDPEQLWVTTMDPQYRTVLKVTLEDAAEADETFSILMGDKVEPRREFIEKNAKFVENLDV
jgi:DNA gyrase subunit B